MKLLVFAHTPPPHHGQSYMVQLMLEHLGGDVRAKDKTKNAGQEERSESPAESDPGVQIECYHVNARLSEDIEDIGSIRYTKALLVLRYCLEALWCRFRYGVTTLYYVPAPGKRAALYRDWIVMALCRPFFRRLIYHWHAAGLGDWLCREGTAFERWLTHRLLGRIDLSVSIAIPSMRDALWFLSKHVEVIPYGIPDPCPHFHSQVGPVRMQRAEARGRLGKRTGETHIQSAGEGESAALRVLYLSHCTREKGIFDTLEGVALANRRWRGENSPHRAYLEVAGEFLFEHEREEFLERIRMPDLVEFVKYHGFVTGQKKSALLQNTDVLCFPTYYHAETFGLVIVEAMAYGLPVITTRWRATTEILPPNYSLFVHERAPEEIASALHQPFTIELSHAVRKRFLDCFTSTKFSHAMQRAFLSTQEPSGQPLMHHVSCTSVGQPNPRF